MNPLTATTCDEIRSRLATTPVVIGQIDVNGKCNARCWYCPVRYEGHPVDSAVQMPIADLDRIQGTLRAAGCIAADFRFLYSCHYNEVLLYRLFPALLET